MLDFKLSNILKIMCEVRGNPHKSRKFNSETIEASNSPSCRTNRAPQNKTDKTNANDTNVNIPSYFRSSINRAADRRASKVLMKQIYNKFINVFFRHRLL